MVPVDVQDSRFLGPWLWHHSVLPDPGRDAHAHREANHGTPEDQSGFLGSVYQVWNFGISCPSLLTLISSCLLNLPCSIYVVPADEQHGDARLDLEQFDLEEKVFYQQDDKD